MQVSNVWVGKDVKIPVDQDEKTKKLLPLDPKAYLPRHWALIEQGLSCNVPQDYGATDKCMVDLLERCGITMDTVRKKHKVGADDEFIRFPFSSKRKRMSTIISNATGAGGYDKRIHVKGAAELIFGACTHYMDENGTRQKLDDRVRNQVNQITLEYADQALRTIGVAYRDLEPGLFGRDHNEATNEPLKDVETQDLTLICIFGIYDIIRSEVPQAVADCQRAGVTVRMVTGDKKETARAIAVLCGIITPEEKLDEAVCIDGPEFFERMGGLWCMNCKNSIPLDCTCKPEERVERVKNFNAFKTLEKKVRVMSRSRPEDKYLLVTGLMNMNQVVAVTGDGTNDAPALSKANVGFGMAVTGTEVCKMAADIIIMDDSFTSVVKACKWGRNIYDNIKRFLQFQLTVNVNALIFTVVGSILLKESPLQAIQLLWVNMIMDSLASLALATEMPRPELLHRPPQNRDDFVVSRKMTKHILYMSFFQMAVLFFFLYVGEYIIPEPNEKLRFPQYRALVGMGDNIDSKFVFPGRLFTINGEPLYKAIINKEEVNGDASRHMTFIFNLFIWLQIINMMCARKIHDEYNLCDGFFANPAFLIILAIIIILNFLIIQFTGSFFQLHPSGLSWEQHLIAIGVSCSVFVANAIFKCIPDDCAPKIGKDSVDERRIAAKQKAIAAR